MQPDSLNKWEKAGLLALGAGGVVNVLFYQLGFTLADANDNVWLFAVRVIFAVCSFIGFDLTLVTAVMAMRAGRRSVWAGMTALLVLLAAGGMSLDVAEVLRLPAWHAAPVVVLAAFALHLAAPRVAHKAEALAQAVAQRDADLRIAGDEVAHLGAELARERERVAQHDAEAARLRGELAQAGAAVAQLRRELAHEQQRVAQPAITDGAEVLTVGARSFSLRQLASITGVAESTLRRKVAQLDEGGN